MHCLGCTLALFVSELSLVLAQQPCYWPNGSSIVSSQGTWINCYSSQASVCCYHGDICLTNGLCYGSQGGMVRALWSSSSLHVAPYAELILTWRQRRIEAHVLSKIGVTQRHVRFNGAMTVNILFTANLCLFNSHLYNWFGW